MIRQQRAVAIVGAGIAGAAAARALTNMGHAVHVFEKSRGPGGRLATRRVEWVDRHGHAATTRLDHGALGFTAKSLTFQAFADLALRAGWLAHWKPVLAPSSLALDANATLIVPVPDMPEICRQLLNGVPISVSYVVDGLHRNPSGWQLQVDGVLHTQKYDAVVLALPPSQAEPLLKPHRSDWASRASAAVMQPCWTLMGITDDPAPHAGWDLARPASGPLAWALRNDTRPGRAAVPRQAHWVAHARTDWSLQHLEQPAAWVQQKMQTALAECLGRPVDWHYCTAHRWRYALPQATETAQAAHWWDADLGLGVCGDFLGGAGVEGAWLSAQALTAAFAQSAPNMASARVARTNAEAGYAVDPMAS